MMSNMTLRLEREDATITSWMTTAHVTNGRLLLETSAFFPGGGGQPADSGTVRWDGGQGNVTLIEDATGDITLELDAPIDDGTHRVQCSIDAPRRNLIMRTHTAFHLIAAVLGRQGSLVTGCSLEPGRARGDFTGIDSARARLAVAAADSLAAEGHQVRVEWISRAEFESNPDLVRLATDLVPDVDPVRIINIEGVDRQADGGTHVANTCEIGSIVFEKFESKGSRNKRISFSVAEPR